MDINDNNNNLNDVNNEPNNNANQSQPQNGTNQGQVSGQSYIPPQQQYQPQGNPQQPQQNPYGGQFPYQQQYNYQPPFNEPQPGSSGMAIASLVLGIVGVVFNCCTAWFISIPSAIVGLIMGIMVLRNKKPGKSMAIVGIVLSSIGLLVGILVMLGYIILLSNRYAYDQFMRSFLGDNYKSIMEDIMNQFENGNYY